MRIGSFLSLSILILSIIFLIYSVNTDKGNHLSPSEDGSAVPNGIYSNGQNSLTYEVNLYGKGPGWRFYYNGSEETVEYYILQSDMLDSFFSVYVRENGTNEFTAFNDGGTVYRNSSSSLELPGAQNHNPILYGSSISNNILTLNYNENDGYGNSKTYRFIIQGKTLVLEFESNENKTSYLNSYAGIRTGSSLSGLKKKTINLDYMGFSPVNLLYNLSNSPLYFYSLYPDYTFSNTQSYFQSGDCTNSISSNPCRFDSYYLGRTGNTKVLPLKERYYLTASSSANDLIVKVNNPVSPYISNLNDKLYLDQYNFENLNDFGDDEIILKWTSNESGNLNVFWSLDPNEFSTCLYYQILRSTLNEGLTASIYYNGLKIPVHYFSPLDRDPYDFSYNLRVNGGDNVSFSLMSSDNRCERTFSKINLEINGKEKSYSGGDLTFVYEGDSITAPLYSWAYKLSEIDEFFGNGRTINVATNGDRTENVLAGWNSNVTANAPQNRSNDESYFLVMIGTNDIKAGEDATQVYANLVRIWAMAKLEGFKVVAFTIPSMNSTWLDNQNKVRNWTLYNNYILSDSSKYDYLVRADLVFPDLNNLTVSDDGLHPNWHGHQLLAQEVSRVLAGAPRRSDSEYSSDQLRNGWSYLMKVNGEEIPLQYDDVLKRWQSDEYSGYISRGYISPISSKYFYHMNNLIDNLYSLGVEKLIFVPKISYRGHSSYLNEIPSSFPMGGDVAMKILSNKLKEKDSLFGLYFLRMWFSPNYPSFDPNGASLPNYTEIYGDQLLRNNDGNLSYGPGEFHPELGYCNGKLDICSPTGSIGGVPLPLRCPTVYPFGNECLVQPFVYYTDFGKVSKSISDSSGNYRKPLAQIGLEDAEREFNLTTVYIDILSSSPPESYIDFYRNDSLVKSYSEVINASRDLSLFYKNYINGPVDGESSASAVIYSGQGLDQKYKRFDALIAGYSDYITPLVDYSYADRNNSTFIPDFVHDSLTTLYVPFGIGITSRALSGDSPTDSIKKYDIRNDWYRALEVGYGFGSYQELGQGIYRETAGLGYNDSGTNHEDLVIPIVREYYQVTGIQNQYINVPVSNIQYESNGIMVDLSNAIKEGVDFTNDKVKVTYSSGFVTYVNYDSQNNWSLQDALLGNLILPPYGYVMHSLNGDYVSASFILNSHRVDYTKTPTYTYADTRDGSEANIFGFNAKNLIVESSQKIIYCENGFGCFDHLPNKTPLIQGTSAFPSTVLKDRPTRIYVNVKDIYPETKIYYNGSLVNFLSYGIFDEGTDSDIISMYYNPTLNLRLGNNTLEIRNPNSRSVYFNIYVSNSDSDSDSVPNEIDSCPNTLNSSRVNILDGCPLPKYLLSDKSVSTSFEGINYIFDSGFFSLLNTSHFDYGIHNLSRIRFNNVNLLDKITDLSVQEGFRYVSLDLDDAVKLDHNYIYVNSTRYPGLNVGSNITFYSTGLTNPVLYKDGALCDSNQCSITSFDTSTGDVTAYVSGFSNYSVAQGTCGDNICSISESCSICAADCGPCNVGGPGGSGSGGSGGGGSPVVRYQCNDGVDNDGDNLIDFPADPGCSIPTDDTELDSSELGGNLTNSTGGTGDGVGGSGNSKSGKILLFVIFSLIGAGIVAVLSRITKYFMFRKKLNKFKEMSYLSNVD